MSCEVIRINLKSFTYQGKRAWLSWRLAKTLVPRSFRVNMLAEFDKDRSPAIASVNRGDPTPLVSETLRQS